MLVNSIKDNLQFHNSLFAKKNNNVGVTDLGPEYVRGVVE